MRRKGGWFTIRWDNEFLESRRGITLVQDRHEEGENACVNTWEMKIFTYFLLFFWNKERTRVRGQGIMVWFIDGRGVLKLMSIYFITLLYPQSGVIDNFVSIVKVFSSRNCCRTLNNLRICNRCTLMQFPCHGRLKAYLSQNPSQVLGSRAILSNLQLLY